MKTLYSKDTKNRLRVWTIYNDEKSYWTETGLVDGKKTTSKPTFCEPKNIGKTNETTAFDQTLLEVEYVVKKKMKKDWFGNVEDAMKSFSFKPMLAHKYDPEKTKLEYPIVLQPKLDGIRCIINKDGAFTRNGERIVTVPHILNDLKPLFESDPSTILDGELYNHDLKDDFDKIVSLVKKIKPTDEDLKESEEIVQYWIYDYLNSEILENEINYQGRFFGGIFYYEIDVDNVNSIQPIPCLKIDEFMNYDLDIELDHCIDQGYEGMMIRLNEPYDQKRSKSLLKYKKMMDEEFEIVDILSGKGNWDGIAKKMVLKLNEIDDTFEAGLSITMDEGKKMILEKENYIGKQATVVFQNYTPKGKPRFGIVKATHLTERW